MAVQSDGKVLIGGAFTSFNATPRNRIARLLGGEPSLVAPTITSQPQSETVALGNSVTFSVTATGTQPLSYQWRKDGVNLSDGVRISGATTAAITITNVQPADAGLYSVVITNLTGSVTSAVAQLTVLLSNAPPVITLTSPTNGAVFTTPAVVPLQATASDPDGSVLRVDFYAGTNWLGSVTNETADHLYTFTWSTASLGTNLLTAVAFDNRGATATSSPPVSVLVVAGSVVPVFQFAQTNYFVSETNGSVTVTVLREGGGLASVGYTTADVTAQALSGGAGDYLFRYGTLEFAAGENAKTIDIPIIDDTEYEAEEVFECG